MRVEATPNRILHVDETQSADLHVLAGGIRRPAEHERCGAAAQLDGIISHETMAAHDQVERALALADAALSDHQDAEAEDVHQHAVDHGPRRQAAVEDGDQPGHGLRRGRLRRENRHAVPIRGLQQRQGRGESLGDDDAREIVGEDASERFAAGVAAERLEVADLTLAQDQCAAGAQVAVEPGQRQPGFLRLRVGDPPRQAGAAGDQFQIECTFRR